MANSTRFVLKRDGKEEQFDVNKIYQAIVKAYKASSVEVNEGAVALIGEMVQQAAKERISVEEIQDLVEQELMKINPVVAKRYIIYRQWRTVEREKRTQLKHIMDGIVSIEKNDVNLGNANMSAHTPAGQMMTFASETTKDYATKYLLSPVYASAHNEGDIHIHDLDYYPTKTATCVQYDLEDLFQRGFKTKNGSIRTPQSIQSYATLATIVFQTNQNEQHGGQAIPAFDYFMAPGVRKTYEKHILDKLVFLIELRGHGAQQESELRSQLKPIISACHPKLEAGNTEEAQRFLAELIANGFVLEVSELELVLANAYERTRRDTHQAMEGFIHNLNTMHSRGGNQVVFSSINYGTDTSDEGRMVMTELLSATQEGLGKGEIPIFPIQIFKVKEGISYSDEDYALAMTDFQAALEGRMNFSTPNFDLLIQACRTTAHALFPNFVFLDTEFNKNDKWQQGAPKSYLYEVATMGCRTRVYENLHGEKSSVGRGNLSFTTMNLPRLAIEALRKARLSHPHVDEIELRRQAISLFFDSIREMARMIAEQLYERYEYQRTALARQFPFMLGNDVWKGGAILDANDEVGDVWRSGTLGIGFIGGHNAMVALYGAGHGHNDEAWNTLYQAVGIIKEVAEEYKAKYQLNYSVLATPAEGLAGRFTRIDRKRYGTIAGVNDLDYYVNSFHVDVKEPIGMFEKIKREAPFHALTLGGHISYIELDGEAKKNVSVVLKLVKTMKDEGIGYGSINHPIDTCSSCGYRGIIYSRCPVCQGEQISRLRRITGYLTGSLESWNSAKKAEEQDRVKHC